MQNSYCANKTLDNVKPALSNKRIAVRVKYNFKSTLKVLSKGP